jgi:hypothetical protein
VPTDIGRSGERQHVNIWMLAESATDRRAVAAEHVEHPGRKTGLNSELGHPLHRQRRLLGGLQDHGAAGGQCRRELPAAEGQREVPGHHRGDHTGRLAGHQGQFALGRGRDVAGLLVGEFAVEAQAADQRTQFDLVRGADRLAHLEADQQGDLVPVGVDQAGELLQDLTALAGVHPWPPTPVERLPGRRHRRVRVGRLSPREVDQDGPVAGRVDGPGGSIGRRPELAADQHSGPDLGPRSALAPVDRRYRICRRRRHPAPFPELTNRWSA